MEFCGFGDTEYGNREERQKDGYEEQSVNSTDNHCEPYCFEEYQDDIGIDGVKDADAGDGRRSALDMTIHQERE